MQSSTKQQPRASAAHASSHRAEQTARPAESAPPKMFPPKFRFREQNATAAASIRRGQMGARTSAARVASKVLQWRQTRARFTPSFSGGRDRSNGQKTNRQGAAVRDRRHEGTPEPVGFYVRAPRAQTLRHCVQCVGPLISHQNPAGRVACVVVRARFVGANGIGPSWCAFAYLPTPLTMVRCWAWVHVVFGVVGWVGSGEANGCG